MRKCNYWVKGKKIAVLSLLFWIVYSPTSSLAKEPRQGTILVLGKKDGRLIRGELLAVKESTLILLNHDNLSQITENIGEIKHIGIEKKSGFLKGLGYGLLIGAASGAALGFLSGNDESGLFFTTAGQKAWGGALVFGILGASIGGIWGAVKGIDESISLEGISEEELKQVLKKLASQARFSSELPENFARITERKPQEERKLEPETSPARVVEKIKMAKAHNAGAKKFSRIHFSFIPGYFSSQGVNAFSKVFDSLGFGEDESYGSWVIFPGGIIEYPWIHQNPTFFIREIRLEYSFSRKIALGLSYSPLGSHRVAGRTVIPDKDYRWPDFQPESYLNGKYKGNAYFFTASYGPLPDAFLKKTAFKLGVGAGYANVSGAFLASLYTLYGEEQENNPYYMIDRTDFTRHVLCFTTFGEFLYFFSKKWSLGLNVDYKYVPCRWKASQLEAPFWYYPASQFQGGTLVYESFTVNIPSGRFNAGGFGVGVNFGFHF